ncbi:hypothetical protein AB0X56_04375 [Weissella paramesenteroides]|uniref:hypothetical protein n=1 Tax=Weissella paramesenteroides TaxID=1249 RepID=UPI003F242948
MVSLLIKIVLAVVLGSILSWIIAIAAILTLLWWLNKDEQRKVAIMKMLIKQAVAIPAIGAALKD